MRLKEELLFKWMGLHTVEAQALANLRMDPLVFSKERIKKKRKKAFQVYFKYILFGIYLEASFS